MGVRQEKNLGDFTLEVAEAPGLPLGLDPNPDQGREATQHQGQGQTAWERYGIESFTCLQLYHACSASVRMGAAITFA